MKLDRHGARTLAVMVVMQAVTDYRKLKRSKEIKKKLESGWVLKEVLLKEVEKFFSEGGGADYYLELSGMKVDAVLIIEKLKNE